MIRRGAYTILCVIVLFVSSCKSTNRLEYNNIYSFQDNYALIEKDGKYGVIDTALREIVNPTLDEYIGYDLSPYFFNSWFYGIRNDSIIVYDTSGHILHYYKFDSELTPNVLSDQSYYIDSLLVRTADKRYLYSGSTNWGCLTPGGDTIVPFKYEQIKKGLDSSIICTRGGDKNLETYVYNLNGDTLRRTYNYPILPWKVNDYYFFVQTGSQIQLRNAQFEDIDTIYFQDIIVSNNYVWLKSDSTWNRYNSNLELKDGPYEKILQNKYWGAIWKNQKVAIINSKGEFVTPFIYEGSISDYISNSRYIVARNKQQLHILNSNGEVIKFIKR